MLSELKHLEILLQYPEQDYGYITVESYDPKEPKDAHVYGKGRRAFLQLSNIVSAVRNLATHVESLNSVELIYSSSPGIQPKGRSLALEVKRKKSLISVKGKGYWLAEVLKVWAVEKEPLLTNRKKVMPWHGM